MPRETWLLRNSQPAIKVMLREPFGGFEVTRTLLADTGAGSQTTDIDLVLSDWDGQRFGEGFRGAGISSGAIEGEFPLYIVTLRIPSLGSVRRTSALIVPHRRLPSGFDGIATFHLLNSFTYGNFGQRGQFGLELP